MMNPIEGPICKRCRQSVIINRQYYDLFEQMHWLCFHLEYEHRADPDEACADPSCPFWHLEVLQRKLASLGYDPKQVITEAIEDSWR